MQKPIDDHIPAPAEAKDATTCTCTCSATSADKDEDALESVKSTSLLATQYDVGGGSC